MPKDYQEVDNLLIEYFDTPTGQAKEYVDIADIRSLMSRVEDSTHQATVEEVIKIAKSLEKKVPTKKEFEEMGLFSGLDVGLNIGYNQALTDLIKAIKK